MILAGLLHNGNKDALFSASIIHLTYLAVIAHEYPITMNIIIKVSSNVLFKIIFIYCTSTSTSLLNKRIQTNFSMTYAYDGGQRQDRYVKSSPIFVA